MTTRDVYRQVVDAAVRTHFDFSSQDILNEVDGAELFSDYSPDTPSEQLGGMAGASYGTLTVEGQQYGFNRLYPEYKKQITLRKYTSELQWTEEDIHWIGKANEQKQTFKLAEISSNGLKPLIGNVNKDMAKFIYLSAGTTFFVGGDGKALVASDHPIRKTGATQSNIVTGNYQLTANAVDAAIKQMNRFVGQNGVQFRKVRRLRLVVGIELESTALQIRDSLYGPNTANLGLQKSSSTALKRRGIDFDVVVLPEIPTAYGAYWWLIDLDRAENRLLMGWGWKPRMAEDTQYNQGTQTIDASTLFGPSAIGWQFMIGSPGTGIAP